MKKIKFSILMSTMLICSLAQAQQVIHLYDGVAPGSENQTQKEVQTYSEMFKTEVVYNVTDPTLLVYKPEAGVKNTGTSVIIAPGGGFMSLSINREGVDLAKWLSKKGITAFVLKYRLMECKSGDPAKEMMNGLKDRAVYEKNTASVIVLATQDARTAVKYVRSHAAQLGVDPQKLGFIGFSAGATVCLQTVLDNSKELTPNFAASIYGGPAPALLNGQLPTDKLPLFICAATNDQLKLTPKSVQLYTKWFDAQYPVEMHLFAEGGHGFGMGTQNLPVDGWKDLYYRWMQSIGF